MHRRAHMCFLNIQRAFIWPLSYHFSAIKELRRNLLRLCWICKLRLRKQMGLPRLCRLCFPKCKKHSKLWLLKGSLANVILPIFLNDPETLAPAFAIDGPNPECINSLLHVLSYLNGVPLRTIRMIWGEKLAELRFSIDKSTCTEDSIILNILSKCNDGVYCERR